MDITEYLRRVQRDNALDLAAISIFIKRFLLPASMVLVPAYVCFKSAASDGTEAERYGATWTYFRYLYHTKEPIALASMISHRYIRHRWGAAVVASWLAGIIWERMG
jgi:hypothetical protein